MKLAPWGFFAALSLAAGFQDPPPPAPVIFNATRSARPGDLVSLQGENFGSEPQVWLDVPDTKAKQLALENKAGSGWIAVRIPPETKGSLTLRVWNGTSMSPPARLNQALPLHLDALQIVPGGAFRIFGRNLRLPGSTPVVTVDKLPAALKLEECDESMLVAVAPVGLQPGPHAAILVDNGYGSGPVALDRTIEAVVGATGDPYKVGVGWTAAYAPLLEQLYPAAATGKGEKDDSEAIQEAIDKVSALGGGVVTLPEGVFRIAKPLTLKSRIVLQGVNKDRTTLRYEKSNYPVWASKFDLIGLRNLTIANGGADVEGPLIKGNTRVLIQNVRFDLGVSQQIYLSDNRNIVVTGCEFIQKGSLRGQGPYVLSGSAGLSFTKNETLWKDGAPTFQESHDSYIADNTWTRDASVQNTPVITTHCCVIDFCHRVAVVGNTFAVTNGPVTNRERNDGETILTEGGGGHRTENLGSVASATADTLSDPTNTINVHPFSPDSIPENYGVAIVDGRGAGQTRRVLAYAQKTLKVDRAWDLIPDATSRYATFVWGLEKSLIKNNRLTGNPRGIWLYHTAIREVDVVGNRLSEGGGIYLRTWQSIAEKQFTPIYGVRIAGNTMSNTTGIWASHIASVFAMKDVRPFGIGQIGIEIRDNQVTANGKNLQLNLEDYAGLEGCYVLLKPETGKYEAPAVPSLLGTLIERNRFTNCDTAVRLGTGSAGAMLSGNTLMNSKTLWTDTPAHAGLPTSQGTVVKEK